MPRLEWKPSERMGVEAQCGGYTLHVLENPSVADLMAGHATMYEWRVYRHSWVMRVGQRGRDEPRNTMPTMAAAQDAAEAEAARLLAEDAGVRALLATAEPRDYPCRTCAGTGWMHPDDPAGECRICDGHGTLTADAFAKDIAADLREVERERDELRAMLPKAPETPWGVGAHEWAILAFGAGGSTALLGSSEQVRHELKESGVGAWSVFTHPDSDDMGHGGVPGVYEWRGRIVYTGAPGMDGDYDDPEYIGTYTRIESSAATARIVEELAARAKAAEDDTRVAETTLGDVADALGVPLGDRPEGIVGAAKAWRERAEVAEERIAEGRATALESVFALIHSRLHLDPFINAAFRSRVASPDGEVLGALICQLSDERARLCRSMEANERWAMPSGAQNAGFADTIARAARCEAAEARVAEMAAALRWRSVGEELPAAGQCVMVPNPMAGMNSRKEVPRYVERYYNHPHRIWLDLDGRTVPPPTHWRPLLPGPEVKS